MLLIAAAVLLSGVVVSKVFWLLGLRDMLLRYPLAVACSYGIFFLLVRIWLWYVAVAALSKPSGGGLALDGGELAYGLDGAQLASEVAVEAVSSRSPRFGMSDLENSEGEGAALLLLGLMLMAVFGSSLYLIWEAPTVLGEAAFQMILATSLRRAAPQSGAPGWAGSVFRKTWVPFVAALLVAGAFACAAKSSCPRATRLTEVLHECRQNSPATSAQPLRPEWE